MAKKCFFLNPLGCFFGVFFGFFLGLIDFSPSNYRVLLDFIGFFLFLKWVLGYFWFSSFELFLILALLITRFYDLLWGLIGLYWVFSLFLRILGLFKKTKKIRLVGFSTGFFGFFWAGFFGFVFFGHPCLEGRQTIIPGPETPVFMIQIDLKSLSYSSGTASHTSSPAWDYLLCRFMNKMGNRLS